jgi:hypothetical protein
MSDIPDNGSFNLGLANIASQNYGPTAVAGQANTNASTQLTQQQTQAAAMENQVARARQPLILAKLHAMSDGVDDQSGVGGVSSGPPASPPERLQQAMDNSGTADESILKPGAIDEAMRAQYFVPAVPPGAVEAMNRAYLVDPTDKNGLGPKSTATRIDMWKAQQTQASQYSANNDFDKLSAVTDAPEGQAMNLLRASHPEVYAAIQRQFAKDPDKDRDEDDQARLFAAHAAGAVHQYTGREAKPDGAGVYRDAVTGLPIPGVEQVGLSTEQYLKLAHEAIAPTQMDDGNGGKVTVPAWKAAQLAGVKGINGPGDWVMVRASQANLPGAAATLSANSAQKQEARKVAQKAVETAQKQQATAPPAADGTPPTQGGLGVARNAQGNVDPALTTALQDKDFDYKPTFNGKPWHGDIGQTPPPAVIDDTKNQTAARNDLAKTTSQGVGAASAALTMYKAAQDVLAKGRYDGGAWNAELAKYSKWLPAGWQDHLAGDYQEVAKYLGNAALQSGKGIFAKMTEKESDAVMHDLNPSPGMDPGALRDMISRGINTAQYSLDSAKRVPAYLALGKDANQFGTWNQTHFPMEVATQPTVKSGASGKYSDEKVKAYMRKYGLKDEAATRKALGM